MSAMSPEIDEATGGYYSDIMNNYPLGHRTESMTEVEHRFGKTLHTLLREKYLDEGLSLPRVADELGVSRRTVIRWMEANGVPRRRFGWKAPRALR